MISGTGTAHAGRHGHHDPDGDQHLYGRHDGGSGCVANRRLDCHLQRRDGRQRRHLAGQRHGCARDGRQWWRIGAGCGGRQCRSSDGCRCCDAERRIEPGDRHRHRRHRSAHHDRCPEPRRHGDVQGDLDAALWRHGGIRDGEHRHRRLRQCSRHGHRRALSFGQRSDHGNREEPRRHHEGWKLPVAVHKPKRRCEDNRNRSRWRANGPLRRSQDHLRFRRYVGGWRIDQGAWRALRRRLRAPCHPSPRIRWAGSRT